MAKLAANRTPTPQMVVAGASCVWFGCDYLSGCNISVVSCFSAKTKFENSNAFGVCLATKDEEKLLDNIWPCNVIIRNRVFIQR
jgi:hypothetical protein